uniref:probable LRR receptor-like serine/threonine-protein kinase At3g47570 n=1 Tax=Erigeron canadensis TaxID=72917 RepID=UPI001CB8CD7D|nr:probable LRR receptor-like serine/threonine-protein kinase At3g47570 [Erigeron canadensis]
MENNEISGSLPKDIGLELPNLEKFNIWGNKFTGSIPFSFSNCSYLLDLVLNINNFTGKVNIDFRRMPNLRLVALNKNNLGNLEPDSMNFIDSMVGCSKLKELYLDFNQFTGVLPSSIGNLSSQLTILSFENNFIYGTLPPGIGNLVKLEKLTLDSNQITGMLPSELGNLQNLKYIFMNDNFFTGNFPKFIGNLSLLELSVAENRLKGHIPPNLGNCTGLLGLDLSINNLTGPIPVELFQLSSLSIILDLSHNYLVGPLPQEIEKLKSLTTLDLSHNDLVGAIPNAIASCTSLEYLNLGANSFEGLIPPSMSVLRGISDLNLSTNNFSGQIPKFLKQLNLSSLDLSFNNLDGELPSEGIFKNASLISIQGNNGLCGGLPEFHLPKCAIVSRSKTGSRTSRVIPIVIPIFSLIVIAMVLFYLFCWKRIKAQAQPSEEAPYIQPFSRVSYGSILRATNKFSQQNLIGTGAFSVVYKGILEPVDEMLAIKVLKLGNHGALKSFMMECEALKNIRHRNLVKVITSCSSVDFQGNDFKAIIYEFMPNGNLERWLHPNSEQYSNIEEAPHPQRLILRQRVTIARDVAHAMHYLHQECEVPIIHCDLKPSNILLDNDMVAHIGDFGLAKFLPLKLHESSTAGLRGTIGYAAPEYGLGGEMTKEGDIYSFGILLLEMIIGKRPTDQLFQDGLNLHGYVTMALPDRLMEIIEPTLLSIIEGANVNHDDEARRCERLEESLILLARIGLACSMESPKERMNSSKIIQELYHINGLL